MEEPQTDGRECGFESAQRDAFVLEVRSLEYSKYDSLTSSLPTPSTLRAKHVEHTGLIKGMMCPRLR
jgi:hypothetical protein